MPEQVSDGSAAIQENPVRVVQPGYGVSLSCGSLLTAIQLPEYISHPTLRESCFISQGWMVAVALQHLLIVCQRIGQQRMIEVLHLRCV